MVYAIPFRTTHARLAASILLLATFACDQGVPVDTGAPLDGAGVFVEWVSPADGSVVENPTSLVFRGRSMVNVEVFRNGQFVARATVDPSGSSAKATLERGVLADGPATLTAHAWNSPPGTPFTDDADAGARSFTIDNGRVDTHPAGYTLVFSDEFEGTDLDRSRWCTRYVYGGGRALQVPDSACQVRGDGTLDFLNDEQQRYVDFNRNGEPLHVVADGVLSLRATRTRLDDNYATYEAAMLRSKQTFRPSASVSYYLTARVRLPSVIGTWPAFWLNPDRRPDGTTNWPPEIDIFEGALNGVEDRVEMLHQGVILRGGQQTDSRSTEYTYTDPAFERRYSNYHADRSLRDRFIEVSLKWTLDDICFYVDGRTTACENYRWVENSGATAAPAHVLLNLAIGGPNWAGRHGIEAGRFPTSLDVDFVRIYAGP